MLYRASLLALALLPTLGCAGTSRPVPEFQRFIEKTESGQPVVVAYLGGSITEGATTYPMVGTDTFDPETDSWRALGYDWLRERFEQKPGQFLQVNAAIGGTPSLLGAYRLEQHVLREKPDMVFVEFAVNDNEVARLTRDHPDAPRSILRTNRSIVERLRAQNPDVAIFMPLSPRRMLEGSAHAAWGDILDLGHDQTRLAAESLRVPYVSLREAFYGDPPRPSDKPLYDGIDNPGNYVHPAPYGHQAYAEAVQQTLEKIFETGTFNFDRTAAVPVASPAKPKLLFPETLISHSDGWKIETLDNQAAPIMRGKSCLVPSGKGALEYRFKGSAAALWFDSRTTGSLDLFLDGKQIGTYGGGNFLGRFVPLADGLDDSVDHTLRLAPISDPDTTRILLRGIAVDLGTNKELKVADVELIYTEDEIPIRYDGSLSTIRRNGEMHFFHSFGCRFPPVGDEAGSKVRRSRHSWHKGTPLDPLKTHLFSKTEEELWDYNGYYQEDNLTEEGIWILGMHECPNGDLLAITHAELNTTKDWRDTTFAMGIGYSTDNGASWTYCGETIRPADDRQNSGGGAYIIKDGYLYVYYNDVIPAGELPTDQNRLHCVARAPLDEVIAGARKHEVTPWFKYADGKWEIPGLGTNQPGEDLIPTIYGAEDLHADAAYCTAFEKYLLTIQTHENGKLLLFSSPDGLNWEMETVIDSNDYEALQPYAAFVDFNGPSADCHTVDGDFYLYFPRKGPDHDYDYMYRCKITIE
ncbi:MAG: GDSL-type esterase/lipase family protein [Verrucomicrobiota bacterium]